MNENPKRKIGVIWLVIIT